jgi:hypothetical protein
VGRGDGHQHDLVHGRERPDAVDDLGRMDTEARHRTVDDGFDAFSVMPG